MDILDSSLHDERFPAEIDVYKVPHSRMKQLVSSITRTLPEIQEYLNCQPESLEKTLESMYTIIWELKNHEIIENTVIINKLRERLLARQIDNQSVCNCHEDSDLLRIIELLESVYSSNTDIERNFYWQKLQEALYGFLDDFVPHMEEEENTFQPLLNEYFDYDELKQIKDTVITQHEEWKEKAAIEKSLKRLKRDSESLESQIVSKRRKDDNLVESLPEELLCRIFECLADPRDLARAGQTCRRWYQVSKSTEFWKCLPLSLWERRIWSWSSVDLFEIIQNERKCPFTVEEEEESSSFYEKIVDLMDEVGLSVTRLSVTGSRSLTSLQLKDILKRTSNIRELDCSYTDIGHLSLLSPDIRLTHLTNLDLSGCPNVSDFFIRNIAEKSNSLRWLSLSGCELITEEALRYLGKFSSTLEYLDLSGCFRLSANSISRLIDQCKNLNVEKLSYCSLIEDGPAPDISSGCQNLDSDIRYCCLNYQN